MSGLGDEDTGGGLFVFDGELERIDWLSTTGLFQSGGRFYRLLWGPDLLIYDERGVVRYLRLDDVVEPHDVAVDGDRIVVVSTGSNSILWYSPSGELLRRWTPGAKGDAWHLNNLFPADGRLLCAAFGRFDSDRAWAEPDARDGTGVVVDTGSGEVVLSGLNAPHNPRRLESGWLVCNSGTGEVLDLDEEGKTRRRVELGGWTRGLALLDELLFVGISAHREAKTRNEHAELAVLDSRSFRELARVPLPCREIYDVTLVPASFREGLRRGLRTSPRVDLELVQASMFEAAGVEPIRLWAVGDELPREAMRSRVEVELPNRLRAGAQEQVTCIAHNDGGAILVTAPPHPVSLSCRWYDKSGTVTEGERVSLPRALPPGTSASIDLPLAVPLEPGGYRLCLSLVQEHVAWFDDIDPANAYSGAITVV